MTAKIRANIAAKLREVELFYRHVAESAAKLTTETEAILFYLGAFLTAAYTLRGLLARRGFDWGSWPDEKDRDLLNFMQEERRLVVHVPGAPDVEVGIEYIPYLGDGHYQGMHPAVTPVWFGLPGMGPPSIARESELAPWNRLSRVPGG